MSIILEITSPAVYILKPQDEIETRFDIKADGNEQVNIYYRLVDGSFFAPENRKEAIFSGNAFVIAGASPSITLTAPKEAGDFRLWFSTSADFSNQRAVRVIVSIAEVETTSEAMLFKDEKELVSAAFFRYQKINVKKLLFNKLSEYKVLFCAVKDQAGENYKIIKIGFKHFLKAELFGLNKLIASEAKNFTGIENFIFKEDFGIISYKFDKEDLIGESYNVIDFIESNNPSAIKPAIKSFIEEKLKANFYKNAVLVKDVLIDNYNSIFFGGKIFGMFSIPPHIKISGDDLAKPIKIEGENGTNPLEIERFKGGVEKVYDRSMLVVSKGNSGCLDRSYFFYNPAIKKERIAKLINSREYKFEIRSASPISIQDFYNVLITKTLSENKEIADRAKKSEIINFLKFLKTEKRSFLSAMSVGGLNPREMFMAEGWRILQTCFDDVKAERHVLFDLVYFETQLKINGAYNLIIKNNFPAKAAEEFEDALDFDRPSINSCFIPYISAIEAIRGCAKTLFVKPNDADEYYTALFLMELGFIKNYFNNAHSKIMQFIFRSADRRARLMLGNSGKTMKLYAPDASPEKLAKTVSEVKDENLAAKVKDETTVARDEMQKKNFRETWKKVARNFAGYLDQNPCLVSMSELYKGVELYLKQGENIIGRSRQCDLKLNKSPFVSARHASIELSDYHIKLKDLDSMNGTFVNGDKINEKMLSEECVVTFGDVEFKLEFRTKK